MIIAVIGSRGICEFDFELLGVTRTDVVLTGGAGGVDAWAEAAARRRGVACEVMRPDYARYGRAAPHVRNDAIVKACDRVVAIWDGVSKGTASVIKKAKKYGKPAKIFRVA